MDGHRRCSCGSYAELVGTMHTRRCFVRCPHCGAKGRDERTPFRAWIAWDNEELDETSETITLYELMLEGMDE